MEGIKKLINQSKNIAILTHISEDADCIGTASALSEALCNMGKTADIYISEPLEDRLSFLKVNALIYDENTKIPAYDLCICVDCGDLKRLGSRIKIYENAAHTVNIDHHVTNAGYAEENLIDGRASSAAEVLYGLLEYMKVEITQEIAFYLYIAIASDSGCFKYSNVSPKTMRIAACLLETGIDHAYICRKLFDTYKRECIKLQGHIMENIHEYEDGKICVVSLDEKTLNNFGVDEKNTGDIVNIPRSAEGCEIAVSIREKGEKIKISLRSNGKYDVSQIAVEYGGGGHEMAAGITLDEGSLEDVEEKIVNSCKKVIEEENK